MPPFTPWRRRSRVQSLSLLPVRQRKLKRVTITWQGNVPSTLLRKAHRSMGLFIGSISMCQHREALLREEGAPLDFGETPLITKAIEVLRPKRVSDAAMQSTSPCRASLHYLATAVVLLIDGWDARESREMQDGVKSSYAYSSASNWVVQPLFLARRKVTRRFRSVDSSASHPRRQWNVFPFQDI